MIVSSTYTDFGWGWRTGYAISAFDLNGRGFFVGISDTGVQMANSYWLPSGSSAFLSYDTTSAFRTYQLVAERGVGSLYIDGTLALTLAMETSQSTSSFVNRISFGDPTGGGSNQSQLAYVTYQPVPEPALTATLTTVALLGVGLGFRCRRFRHESSR